MPFQWLLKRVWEKGSIEDMTHCSFSCSQGEIAVNKHVDTKSYTSLHALVHGMFPPRAVEQVCSLNIGNLCRWIINFRISNLNTAYPSICHNWLVCILTCARVFFGGQALASLHKLPLKANDFFIAQIKGFRPLSIYPRVAFCLEILMVWHLIRHFFVGYRKILILGIFGSCHLLLSMYEKVHLEKVTLLRCNLG